MPWGVLAAGVAATGATVGGVLQGNAAKSAASQQQQAAMAQLGLSAATLNAQGAMSLPTREVGGEAQSREAYLLGLDPNLDISADFATPNISTTASGATLNWNGPGANDPSLTGVPQQGQLSSMYGNSPAPTATAGPAGT